MSIWFALGEPPDRGVKKASVEVTRWPKAAGILFSPGRYALDDLCHEYRLLSREVCWALLNERHRALQEVLAARHLLLDPRLQLELLAHSRIQPVVDLALARGGGALRPPRQSPSQRRRLLAELSVGRHAVDETPLQSLGRGD